MLRSILEHNPLLNPYKALEAHRKDIRLYGDVLAEASKPAHVKQQAYRPQRDVMRIAAMSDSDYHEHTGMFRHHVVDRDFVKQIISAGAVDEMGVMGDHLSAAAHEYHAEPEHSAEIDFLGGGARQREPAEQRQYDEGVAAMRKAQKDAEDAAAAAAATPKKEPEVKAEAPPAEPKGKPGDTHPADVVVAQLMPESPAAAAPTNAPSSSPAVEAPAAAGAGAAPAALGRNISIGPLKNGAIQTLKDEYGNSFSHKALKDSPQLVAHLREVMALPKYKNASEESDEGKVYKMAMARLEAFVKKGKKP